MIRVRFAVDSDGGYRGFTAEDRFSCETADGFLRVEFPGKLSEESKLLMNSLSLGLENLVRGYGTEWLEIVTEEV